MNNLSELRQQIATSLTSIEGLSVSAYLPVASEILPPCAFVLPKTIQYGFTLPRLNQRSYFNVQLLISRAKDLQESQSDIDEYLSVQGSKSIAQAINTGNYTNISHVHCETLDQYGGFNYYETIYWGALFTVDTY